MAYLFLVKLLVDSGADVDIVDNSGLTPFQMAIQQGNKAVVDFLLSKGAKKQ